jgi:hypothetical protein
MSREAVTAEQRRVVIERARGCCEYCQSQSRFSTQAFSVEHVIPRARGGSSNLDNLALACQGCNNHKYNHTEGYDSVGRQSVPLYHPRKQVWHEHFAWDHTGTLIVGLTPTGRATVTVLRLNRDGLVNLRRVLYAVGEHPPTGGETSG